MFCNEHLQDTSVPANLAFLNHLDVQGTCKEAFATWTYHMQTEPAFD